MISRGRRLVLAGTLVIAIGSIGPWVDVLGLTESGLDSDGRVTIGLALIAVIYAIFIKRPHWAPLAMIGFFSGFVAIADIIDVGDAANGLAAPGWGLYLTAIGSALLIASAVMSLRTEDSRARTGIAGKVILGVGALLVVLFVISLFTTEEVAEVGEPPVIELEPAPAAP